MKAQQAMTRNVVCVTPEDTIEDARELMEEWRIRHLPVVDGAKLVGILSDRDLLAASEGEATVADIMTEEPITCDLTSSLAAVGETMLEEKIDCLPVLDGNGELAGLITSSDFIEYAIERERLALSRPIPFSYRVHRAVRPGAMAALLSREALGL